jgi:hypothetical protein
MNPHLGTVLLASAALQARSALGRARLGLRSVLTTATLTLTLEQLGPH